MVFCTHVGYRSYFLIQSEAVCGGGAPLTSKTQDLEQASYMTHYLWALWLETVLHKLWMKMISVFHGKMQQHAKQKMWAVENFHEICFNFCHLRVGWAGEDQALRWLLKHPPMQMALDVTESSAFWDHTGFLPFEGKWIRHGILPDIPCIVVPIWRTFNTFLLHRFSTFKAPSCEEQYSIPLNQHRKHRVPELLFQLVTHGSGYYAVEPFFGYCHFYEMIRFNTRI